MADKTDKQPIDKEYLIASLKDFDKYILSKKYANGVTYEPKIGTVTSDTTPDASVDVDLNTNTAEFSFVLPKGDKGDTPYIGENGNWWYGDTDSGIPIPSFLDLLKYVDKNYGIQDTPIGHILTHMGTSAPNHYLICDGKEYQITDYPFLTQHFIDNFGSVNYFGGDGEATFAVPDLRGEFLRGTGNNSHEKQGNGGEVGEHQDATAISPVLFNKISFLIGSDENKDYLTENPDGRNSLGSPYSVMIDVKKSSYVEFPNSYWTVRPTNTSVLYCIKYEPTYFLKIETP